MTSFPSVKSRCRQAELALDLSPTIPLVPDEVARVLLALPDPDYVAQAIENGHIPFAFNIATPDAERGALRIYRESLLDALFAKAHYGSSWLTIIPPRRDLLAELPRVLAACLPPGDKPFIALASLARRWTCSPQHIQNLIDAGSLTALARAQMGPNGSAMITRVSAEQFLTARCETLTRPT